MKSKQFYRAQRNGQCLLSNKQQRSECRVHKSGLVPNGILSLISKPFSFTHHRNSRDPHKKVQSHRKEKLKNWVLFNFETDNNYLFFYIFYITIRFQQTQHPLIRTCTGDERGCFFYNSNRLNTIKNIFPPKNVPANLRGCFFYNFQSNQTLNTIKNVWKKKKKKKFMLIRTCTGDEHGCFFFLYIKVPTDSMQIKNICPPSTPPAPPTTPQKKTIPAINNSHLYR